MLVVAKPLTVIFMMLWSLQVSGWEGAMLFFGLGLLFSLGGDIALLFPARWFLPGLVSFLVAHIMFIIGFSQEMPPLSMFSAGIAIIIGLFESSMAKKRLFQVPSLFAMAFFFSTLIIIIEVFA